MNFRKVIDLLIAEGGRPALSATRGPMFERARRCKFWRCCGSDDPAYRAIEYVGRGPGGGLIFISLRLRTGQIVCGRTGYHALHPEIPPCV
jgi:hypothetical protein